MFPTILTIVVVLFFMSMIATLVIDEIKSSRNRRRADVVWRAWIETATCPNCDGRLIDWEQVEQMMMGEIYFEPQEPIEPSPSVRSRTAATCADCHEISEWAEFDDGRIEHEDYEQQARRCGQCNELFAGRPGDPCRTCDSVDSILERC